MERQDAAREQEAATELLHKKFDLKMCAQQGNPATYLMLQRNSVPQMGKGRHVSFCSPTCNLVGGLGAILINYCQLNISTTGNEPFKK